jgi:hypothetical protein
MHECSRKARADLEVKPKEGIWRRPTGNDGSTLLMMDMVTVTRLGRIPISYYRERSLEVGDSILFVFF